MEEPRLRVVGKIYIDGGDKDKVYTIGSDAEGALRIGDSKSNMVATIDQKTGKTYEDGM